MFLPSPPSDRLYVDRTRRGDARALLAQHADALVEPVPSPPTPAAPADRDVDTDAEFARIVAAFEAEHGPTAPSTEEPRNDLPPPPAELSVLDALDAQDHYEPPPPPPLPVLAPATVYALVLIAVGVLLVVRPSTVHLSVDVGLVLGAAAIVGGVVLLVSRMRDSADDGDDGAVV